MIPMYVTIAALAGEPSTLEIPADGLVITRGSARVSVHEIALPKPYVIESAARICRVSVSWAKDHWVAARRDGCHPNVVEAVDAAIKGWSIEVVQPPGKDQELFEYWYVFPAVQGARAQVLLRQAFDETIALEDADIGVLDFAIRGRMLPEYPPAALTEDTTLTRCSAKLDILPSGVPSSVEVHECDDVFRSELEDNLPSWRFEGPKLDGIPFNTAVTLGFQFDKPLHDGDPGTVKVLMPPALQGSVLVHSHEEVNPEPEEPPPPPMPDWDPLMVLNHKSFAEVRVYDMRWPEDLPKLDHDATCDVLFQVNSARRVWAWAESCDEAVRPMVEAAANQWNLAPGNRERGERFARFRGTFVIPADGSHPYLRVPVGDLVTKTPPENVRTFRDASLLTAVPPRLPRNFATEVLETRVTCEYDVTVDPHGKPSQMTKRTCPGNLGEYAEKALDKWRWVPAESDGKAIPTTVPVKIRFDLGAKAASQG